MAKLLAILGAVATAAGAGACWLVWLDEPEMPSSLIK